MDFDDRPDDEEDIYLDVSDEDEENYDYSSDSDEDSDEESDDDSSDDREIEPKPKTIGPTHVPIELKGDSRKGSKYISHIERSKIIAQRAEDLNQGSPSVYTDSQLTDAFKKGVRGVYNPLHRDPVSIARYEFDTRKIPTKLVRTHMNGDYEIWSIDELMW